MICYTLLLQVYSYFCCGEFFTYKNNLRIIVVNCNIIVVNFNIISLMTDLENPEQ